MKATPKYIVEKLCQAGFDTYIAGGAVRDILSGKTPDDEDITTKAKPEEIQELFKDHSINFGGTFFKVTFVDGIEVATFRKDKYAGLSDKMVKVDYADNIIEDLGRRDLTINAMAFCQFSGEIIDPYKGYKDLKKRTIKFVGNPLDRIHQDPNRIIRACRFLAVIDGMFDSDTLYAMKAVSHYVRDYVKPERIYKEIMKTMKKARYASVFFNALHEIGALKYILPSLDCCYYFDVHGLHHRESIITHSFLAGDNVSCKYPLQKLAAYLHDVGKPESCRYNPQTGDIKFKGHSVDSKKIVTEELKKLKFPHKDIEYVTTLIRNHMSNFESEKSIRRLINRLGNIHWLDLYRVKLADSKANVWKGPYPYKMIQEDFARVERALNIQSVNVFNELAINGKDLIDNYFLKPGPFIGQIKEYLLETILDKPELNTKEDLLVLTRKYVLEHMGDYYGKDKIFDDQV